MAQTGAAEVYPSAVRQQLDRLVAHPLFRRSGRMCRFLQFTIGQVLDGRGGELKEFLVGVEVFDRRRNYDPRVDPIVRVEARRLRAKLKNYYDGDGRGDAIVIEFEPGSYAPKFHLRATPSPVPAMARGTNTIAVLPFVSLTPAAGHEYFSDGLTEELIHALTKVPGMRVVAWASAAQLRERQQDMAAVREQLRAATALTGSVRIAGSSLRVRVQLIDTETGVYLWSETFDRPMQDLFAIQEEMARAIVRTLSARITARAEETPVSRGRTSLSSYDLYLKGRYFWHRRSPEALQQAIRHFEESIAADPGSALPHAGLADSHILLVDYGLMRPAEGMLKVKQSASRALELNPELAEAYPSLALAASHFERDWDQAGRLYKRAIHLNPSYATTYHWMATDHLLVLGDFDAAASTLEIALQLDPLSSILLEGRGFIQLVRRNYAEAVRHYRTVLETDPGFYRAYTALGRAMLQLGNYSEAIEMLEKGRSIAGDVPSILGALGQAHALSGRREKALEMLDLLESIASRRFVGVTPRVMIHLGLGDKEQALNLLEAGYENREPTLVPLAVHPAYEPLHGNPRYQVLLSKLGLVKSD